MESKEDIIDIPKWMRLDNAATIYPYTITKKYAATFRLSITLNEKIDVIILKKALKKVLKRIPSFSYRIRKGLFWYYLSYLEGAPDILEDVRNPMCNSHFKDNKHFMFKVRYHGSRIAIEIFHSLTDGMGAITFLLTLTSEYLKLKYKINIPNNSFILNTKEKPKKEEFEDSFKKVARNRGKLEKEKPAYHVSGIQEEGHIVNIITGKIPIDNLKSVSKKYNCTITEFLAAIMILSIQEIQEKEKSKRRRNKPIKLSIPVNLRPFYNSKTLRNFSSYVNVGIDSQYGHYSLEEIIIQVKNQMGMMITEKKLNAKLTGNVKIENNKLIGIIPAFIKKYILSIGEKMMGDRYCSSNLSNLGNISLPNEMVPYLLDMNVMVGRSKGKPNSAACIGYNNNLYISFSRKIKEPITEKLFFTKLVEMNIPVEIESNQGR
ncbi:MAG: alcohol acetyltransferase [Bacilli bacterium]|nr:alcohol acetyltransferase [Bacilli bacterium]